MNKILIEQRDYDAFIKAGFHPDTLEIITPMPQSPAKKDTSKHYMKFKNKKRYNKQKG